MTEILPPGALRLRQSHIFEREEHEHYVEMKWCNRVLFENEHFEGFLHDPCCGWGRIPEAARAAGIKGVTGSDIVDRGFAGVGIENFLDTIKRHDNTVFNPPFNIFEEFVRHALKVTRHKVCVMMQTKKLNAAHWMRKAGLQHIWYLTPRPSMPPGHVAEQLLIGLADSGKSAEPSGDTKDYCWAVFDLDQPVAKFPTIGWLHRDKGVL